MIFTQLESESGYEQTLNIESNKKVLLQNKRRIMIFCISAGIISGMLGTGGGMIISPFIMGLGYTLQISQNTSNLLLIFNCLLCFISYTLSV